jgi:hypothetical protein
MSNWSNFSGQENRKFVKVSEATSIERDIITMIDLLERSNSGSWAHREWSNEIIHDSRHFNPSMVNGHSGKPWRRWRHCRILQVRKSFRFWRVVCLYPINDVIIKD